MNMEAQTDHAVEIARAADVEAAHGGEGRPECEAEAYADTLGRMHAAYVFDGMVTMYAARYGKCPELHVMPEYFEEHFGHRADIEHEPLPDQKLICRSVMHEGVEIFCLDSANFVVAA